MAFDPKRKPQHKTPNTIPNSRSRSQSIARLTRPTASTNAKNVKSNNNNNNTDFTFNQIAPPNARQRQRMKQNLKYIITPPIYA